MKIAIYFVLSGEGKHPLTRPSNADFDAVFDTLQNNGLVITST